VDLTTTMTKHEKAIDALEQISRANCLILHGTKFAATNNQQMGTSHETEICESHVLKTLNEKLDLPVKLTSNDFDICHPLPSKKSKNPIIIKIVRCSVRNTVFSHKKDLKSTNISAHKLSITDGRILKANLS